MRNLKKTLSTVLVLLGMVTMVPLGVWAAPKNTDRGQSKVWVPGEERIQREVLHQLRMLPYYTIFDNLSFQVNGNTVVLSGEVWQPVLKSDAAGVVKHVEGVEHVVNNIEVLPTSNFDDQIRFAEARYIYRAPGFERYGIQAMPPIHIIVKNGHVTLKGVVANQMDKNIAGIRANSVPNVFSVTNDLRVEKD